MFRHHKAVEKEEDWTTNLSWNNVHVTNAGGGGGSGVGGTPIFSDFGYLNMWQSGDPLFHGQLPPTPILMILKLPSLLRSSPTLPFAPCVGPGGGTPPLTISVTPPPPPHPPARDNYRCWLS